MMQQDYAVVGDRQSSHRERIEQALSRQTLGAPKTTPFTELSAAMSELREVTIDVGNLVATLVGEPSEGEGHDSEKPGSGLFGDVRDAAYQIRRAVKDIRSDLERVRSQI